MSWSINIVSRDRKLVRSLLIASLGTLCLALMSHAQEIILRAPSDAVAGTSVSIHTEGSGSATFYLIGPSISVKRDVELGKEISLSSNELQNAGRYVAVICAGGCTDAVFFVSPAKPTSLIFLVHPSRAPVGVNDVISGVALPFDEFHNLVVAPATVEFQLTAKGSASASHSAQTRNGVAWFHTNSGKSAGPLQVMASINDVTARRVVQQVASDPCNLRIKGQRTAKGIVVETEPVRDCSGNPVPDGTVVTFTAKSGNETSFVDAPVKQDVARATMTVTGPVVISGASGVAMGNELRMGGKE